MFAVIELQWHQYIVREGDTIVVDKLDLEGDSYVASDVLLISDEDGKDTVIGTPYVEGMSVTFDVVESFTKGEKIRVLKFKRKNRYQRVIWHRPHQTILKAVSIWKWGAKKSTSKKEEGDVTEKKVTTKTAEKKPETKATPKKTETKKVAKTTTKTAAKKPATKKTTK